MRTIPELCLTGYTCGDLFFQKSLLEAAEAALVGGGRQEGPEKIRVALAQQTLGIVRPLAVRVVCNLVQHRKGLRLPDARVDLLHHTDKVVGDLADVLRPAFLDE